MGKAQDVAASLTGLVRDPSGSAVANAKVVVTRTETGVMLNAATDERGSYWFRNIPTGHYALAVEAPGFEKSIVPDVLLQINETTRLDVSVVVGKVTETVRVQAVAETVDTSTQTLKEVVDQKRIEELPLNGRAANQLMSLVVGVTPDPAANVTSGTTYGSALIASGVSVNGGHSNTTNYVLDGAQNNDSYNNAPNPFPNPDALQEFSVQTNNFSAEFGRQSGAVVNAITKSGTNAIHGTAFEYVRNYDLNAILNYRFNSARTNDGLRRNQYGFTLGGPIVLPKLYNGRDKTFFFLSYQGTDILQTPHSGSTTVPTAAQRTGNFSDLSTTLKDPTTHAVLPGNMIRTSELSPITQAILAQIPTPAAGTTIQYGTPNRLFDHQLLAKLDQKITDRNQVSGRFYRSWAKSTAYLNPSDILASNVGGDWYDLSMAVTDTYTIKPTLVNQALFSYNRTDGYQSPIQPAKSLTNLGVNYWAPSTYKYEIYVDGYFTINTGDTNSFPRHEYQVLDTLRWALGQHQLTMSGEYENGTGFINNNYPGNGLFTFDSGAPFTGNSLADFLTGHFYSLQQGVGQFKNNIYKQPSLFINDSFKASQRLTLNLGIRWEPYIPLTDQLNRLAIWLPGQHSSIYPNAPPGVLFAGDPGLPKGLLPTDWKNFGPRIGFAYDVFGDGKTSFRGGYGIYFDHQNTIYTNNFSTQAPFGTSVTTYGNAVNSFANPYAGITNPFPQSPNPGPNALFPQYSSQALYDAHFRNPYVQAWNATLEQIVKGNFVLRASYAASKGTRLLIDTQLNPAVYQAGSTSWTTNQRRIYAPALGSTQLYQSVGNSTFNALQLSAERRFLKGFTVLANYQYSKSLDDASANKGTGTNRTNPLSQSFDKGPSDFDHPYVVHISGLWELPIHPANRVNKLLIGGWNLNTIANFVSGYPFTVGSGVDNALTGQGGQRADLTGQSIYISGSRALNQEIAEYLNPGAFMKNALGTYGELGRNTFFGPGYHNIDLGLFKYFAVTERIGATLRLEAFNATNALNLGQPSSAVSSTTFMRITSVAAGPAGAPRVLQLAVRLKW